MPRLYRAALLLSLLLLTACQSTYYSAMEKGGISKRDLFVSRIDDMKDAQLGGQRQFRAALEQYKYTVNFRGVQPEDAWKGLNAEYEASKKAAGRIHNRIKAVESVSDALFDEWQNELDQYTNRTLREQNQGQLNDTRKHYREMLATNKKAEKSFGPVIDTLRESSLYLKRNPNAQAITSLQYEFSTISNDLNRLIREMDEAIVASDRFVAGFNRQRL